MIKARTQPSNKTGIVLKISIAFIVLLAIVLYKLNDHFKQEKILISQSQIRNKLVATKTSVSSQISSLRNVLSSYQSELSENKINWVQLDPFFSIALAKKNNGGATYKITQYVGRSGSLGERWNAAYLEQALSIQPSNSDQPVVAQLFQDKSGSKFLSLRFELSEDRAVIVVGAADYFQKFFDLERGNQMTSLLETTDHVLAAHSEADYVATLSDEHTLSESKYLIEKQEIAGTNLSAISYVYKKSLAAGFNMPWSIVGLILGFGCLIIGFLFYNLESLEKRVERYRKQEREEIFKKTVEQQMNEMSPLMTEPSNQSEQPIQKDSIKNSSHQLDQNLINQLVTTSTAKNKDNSASQFSTKNNEVLFEQNLVNNWVDQALAAQGKSKSDIVLDQQLVDNFVVQSVQTKAESHVLDQKLVDNFVESSLFVTPDVAEVIKQVELSKQKVASKPFDEEDPHLAQTNTGIDVNKIFIADSEPTIIHKLSTAANVQEDYIDLDQVLALDDIDTEVTAKANLKEIEESMTSKKFNVKSEPARMTKPEFKFESKKFNVDSMPVKMRRPERT